MASKFCEIFFHWKKRSWYYDDYGVVSNERQSIQEKTK